MKMPSHRLLGAVAAVGAVALVTAVISVLDDWIPVLSLAVLYLFAVLPVAAAWGAVYGVATSVMSMLAFNFFFLEPIHTLTLSDSRNWFALLVFVVTSVVVAQLQARSRRRDRDAALLGAMATSLLEHGTGSADLERMASDAAGEDASRRRMLPAVVSLLRIASERERLQREALEAEALRQADTMKTALLRAVSHDLRTPLMAISTSAGALARPDLALGDSDRAELLETILAASDRLDHVVSNLLDLSRLQAGAAQPDRRLVDLDELVAGALDELGPAADRVEVALPDDAPAVSVDPHQIQRTIVNLLENALRYSPPDEPVRVQVASGHSEAVVRVIDHGPGVAAADRERIFQPFDRGGRTGDSPGAGLGLAIARGFAEANCGRVTVESLSGQGSTFVVSLPLASAPQPVAP
jgi:two-component system sensor histidine kinase KdpD